MIDDTGGSQLHRVVSPQRMALDKFSGKVNDPWLSRDDAILRGTVGSEGLDQLISFVQRDDAFARARLARALVSSARVMSAILTMLAEAGAHYGSDLIEANLIDVALDQTAGVALVERH